MKDTRRTVRVIGPISEERLRCPEFGHKEMHIYKLDSSYYFCGNCAYKVPVADVKLPKPETTVEPVDGDNKNEPTTFIASIPRRRTPGRRGIIEDDLRKKGLQLTDFYEIY